MKYTLLTFATITAVLVAETAPQAEPDPVASAKQLVTKEIINHLEIKEIRFSRAAPRQPRAIYDKVLVVENEQRLPFSIPATGSRQIQPITGYVRLADQKIFIHDPLTGKFHQGFKNPRLTPLQVTPKAETPKT